MKIYDDIPEALRQTSGEQSRPRSQRTLLIGAGLGVIGVGLGVWWIPRLLLASPPTRPVNSVPVPIANGSAPASTPDTLLGHVRYQEATPDQLEAVTTDGSIRLRRGAAAQFQAMMAAAQADGITLVPLSGFRSLADQKYLFFEVKAERGQDTTQRAEVSAPPGYSEHHTGYAIDIGDGDRPDTHVKTSFEETPAFQWLQANAAHYSFELSFPRNNPQGVAYEPWHWRFVGDQDSLETFYKNQDQQTSRSSAR